MKGYCDYISISFSCTRENSTGMASPGSDVCELSEVSEEMSLLMLDFDTDVTEGRPERGDATCSVSP